MDIFMKQSIASILKKASELPSEQEKIKCLQANASPALKLILKYCFDPSIKWLLPKGHIEYKRTKDYGLQSILYHEVRRLYLFIEDGHPTLTQEHREKLFAALLSMVASDDAELLMSIKDKKLPYPGLTKTTVKKAFTDIF